MRIALVTDTYTPQVNGVTTVVARIARTLRANAHEVAVVAPAYPGAAPPDGGGGAELRVRSLPFPPYPSIRLSLPRPRRIAKFLDAFAPDAVHVHTEGPLGVAGRRYALRRELPLVTTFHTHFPQYAAHYGAGWLSPLVWRWLVRFHRPARLTHTPGTATATELRRRGVPHVRVWGRGVDTAWFRPERRDPGWRRWLAGSDDAVVVLHVGRLAREKNLDVLVQAWELARHVLGQRATFVIAGEGPEGERIRARLPFVRQLGFIDRDRLATLYASADLCVFPSHTETLGLVALEAMASGVPVVAADAGGFRETVVAGETGVLVPATDPHAYLEAIVELACVGHARRRLAAAARRRAVEFDAALEDAELLSQYQDLLPPVTSETPCAA